MKDCADPHAREGAVELAGVAPTQAMAAVEGVLGSIRERQPAAL
jgi:hypothetical protein